MELAGLMAYITLPLRIFLGIIFIAHGYPKLFKFKEYKEKFAQMGLPAFVLFLVGVAEFIGGLGVLVGFLTRFTAVIWSIMMIVATLMKSMKWNKGLVEGYEFDLALLAGALTLFILGSGNYSIDSMIGWISG